MDGMNCTGCTGFVPDNFGYPVQLQPLSLLGCRHCVLDVLAFYTQTLKILYSINTKGWKTPGTPGTSVHSFPFELGSGVGVHRECLIEPLSVYHHYCSSTDGVSE